MAKVIIIGTYEEIKAVQVRVAKRGPPLGVGFCQII